MLRELESAQGSPGSLVFGPIVELLSDPRPVAEEAAEATGALDAPIQPTGWFQRLRNRTIGLSKTPVGRTPMLAGRSCCYETMHRFDGRADLEFPFTTSCPCGRVFRIRLGLAPRR